MSVFNCHVNRAPVTGRLTEYTYVPGKKMVAFHEKASLENEQNRITLTRREESSRSSRSPGPLRGASSSIRNRGTT